MAGQVQGLIEHAWHGGGSSSWATKQVCAGISTTERYYKHSSTATHRTDLAPSTTAACCCPSAAAAALSAHSGSAGSSRAARSLSVTCDSTCSCLKASLTVLRLNPSAACTANTAGRHVTWKGHSAGRSAGSCTICCNRQSWARQQNNHLHTDVLDRSAQDVLHHGNNKAGPTSTLGSGSAAGVARLPGLADLGFAEDAMWNAFAPTSYCWLVLLYAPGRHDCMMVNLFCW